MIKLTPKIISSLAILTSTAGFTASAFSQATIVYGPRSTAVPTLGGTALIALSILMLIVAVRVLKGQKHIGAKLVAVATTASALALGVGGIGMVTDAYADMIQVVELVDANGGEIQAPEGPSMVVNSTEQTQNLIAINADPGCFIGDIANGGIDGGINGGMNGGGEGNYVGECSDSPSTTLEPGDFCDIFVFCET